MTVEEWLGEENQLGTDIWTKKYCSDGEDFEQWLTRVSGGNEKIAEYIRQKKFLFGGRILSNRGLNEKGRKVTYSNCYVIAPPEDNIESIFDCAKKLARTYSYGGGCGVDISGLSPRGAKINNAAKETSGSVFFHGALFPGDSADRAERAPRRAYDLHRLFASGRGGVHRPEDRSGEGDEGEYFRPHPRGFHGGGEE